MTTDADIMEQVDPLFLGDKCLLGDILRRCHEVRNMIFNDVAGFVSAGSSSTAIRKYFAVASDHAIYRRDALGRDDLTAKADGLLANSLYALATKMWRVAQVTSNRERGARCHPWFTFVMISPPESGLDTLPNHPSTDSGRYIFHSFGIREPYSPQSWYRYLEAQQNEALEARQRFTLSSLIYGEWAPRIPNADLVFRLVHDPHVTRTAASSDGDGQQYVDLHLKYESSDNPIVLDCSRVQSEGTKQALQAIFESWTQKTYNNAAYPGLDTYIENFHHATGLDFNSCWTLYGLPLPSFDIRDPRPHSGIYFLTEGGQVDADLLRIFSLILSMTLWPVDQLYRHRIANDQLLSLEPFAALLPELMKVAEAENKLTEVLDCATKLKEIVSGTRPWEVGTASLRAMSTRLKQFFPPGPKHDAWQWSNDTEAARFYEFLLQEGKRSFIDSFVTELEDENRGPGLPFASRLFSLWGSYESVIEKASRELFKSVALAKAIAHGELPGYWLGLALDDLRSEDIYCFEVEVVTKRLVELMSAVYVLRAEANQSEPMLAVDIAKERATVCWIFNSESTLKLATLASIVDLLNGSPTQPSSVIFRGENRVGAYRRALGILHDNKVELSRTGVSPNEVKITATFEVRFLWQQQE